jgi:cytochrome c-type biogenesis protein CcmE
MRASNVKYGLGLMTILGVVVYFGITGFQSARMYYLDVDELDAALHEGHAVKVMGQVAPDSIQWLDHRTRVRFQVQGASGKLVPVAYDGLTPDNFDVGRNVILLGRYTGGSIQAKQVIVQCPSKYEAAEYDPHAAEAHNSATQPLPDAPFAQGATQPVSSSR